MKPRDAEALGRVLLDGEYPDTDAAQIRAAVAWIADLIGVRPPQTDASAILKAVRLFNDKLWFEHTRRLADAWRACRDFHPEITKRHAQALIELSALDAAEALLREALKTVAGRQQDVAGEVERLEYEGLLGRIAKQRFVGTGDKNALAASTDQYLAQYQASGAPYWHGINAAALLAREEREGIRRRIVTNVTILARDILEDVERQYKRNPADAWLMATASEACLALDDCEGAELWLYRFLHSQATLFQLNSYNRQLQEVWQGSAVGSGGSCADRLAGIMARHLAWAQGRWALSPRAGTQGLADAVNKLSRELADDASALEKNFSGEAGFSVNALRQMLAACESIGCVTNAGGERLGTGFLLDGSALKSGYGSGPVFVTNAHVISADVPNAIRPNDARVTFEIESTSAGTPQFYRVSEILFTSPPGPLGVPASGTLDVTIVRLTGIADTYPRLPLSAALPLVDARTKAFVVGHPRGSGLQISLHDSLLLDVDDGECLVHYRTPTDPGSSGSPVFSSQWEVIALHHSGSCRTPRLHGTGHYEANEGIALCAIRAALNA